MGTSPPSLVIPRARENGAGEALPLEYLVLQHLNHSAQHHASALVDINLYGPAGSGKSTAMTYLAQKLGAQIHSQTVIHETLRRSGPPFLAIHTSRTPMNKPIQLELAPWTQDDLIEYLLKNHPAHCASVMARLKNQLDNLEGLPELWTIVLDEFAADPQLTNIPTALRRRAGRICGSAEAYHAAGEHCLFALLSRERYIDAFQCPAYLPRNILRHRAAGIPLAGDSLASEIIRSNWHGLERMLPRPVIVEAANTLRAYRPALEALARAVNDKKTRQPLGASLLVAAGENWRPLAPANLEDAFLSAARWPAIDLTESQLTGADFQQADLAAANLTRCIAVGANFRQANLRHAILDRVIAEDASFVLADLSMARATAAKFIGANLIGACLIGAILTNAQFAGANLTGADLSGAVLASASFNAGTTLENTDLSSTDLSEASFENANLQTARLDNASLAAARLLNCNLENVRLTHANFENASLKGSLLTASRMPRANFIGASLQNTGLAFIDWPHADLRDADFSGASFHLGSARSGLVASTIASEGSRTGFYTDDFEDKHFKNPEEIRKANLQGADLRGANVFATDFYLVDLRDAHYTPDQAKHFARCGAILNIHAH